MGDWDIAIGEQLTRNERRKRFGGALYGGIEPSAKTPNVFVYSDPEQSADIYPYDGWSPDGSVFLYTGEGRLGDQIMTEGNRAIRDHQQAGRALRLFVADGKVPGKSEKNHLYIGEFAVDPQDPYVPQPAPDDHQEQRTVFVFRLLPVGEALRRPKDVSRTGDADDTGSAESVLPERHQYIEYETLGTEPTTARKREAELVKRFEAHLEVSGHTFTRWRIRPPGELLSLLTDTYDLTVDELYEAKGTTTRDAIRRAIGQLFDYRRHLPAKDVRLSILLPARPSEDLLALMQGLSITLVHETEPGQFIRIEP